MKIKKFILPILIIISLTACTNTNKDTDQEKITDSNTESSNSGQTEDQIDSSEKMETEVQTSNSIISESDTKANTEAETADINTEQNTANSLNLDVLDNVDLDKFQEIIDLYITDEVNAQFVLSTDSELADFEINSISYDGETLEIGESIYHNDSITKDTAVVVSTYIPDIFSNIMVTYKDNLNGLKRYFISYNLDIGTVVLSEVPEDL